MDKSRKKKIIFAGIGTAAAGVLGYFGWEYFKNKKNEKEAITPAGSSASNDSSSSKRSDSVSHSSSYNAGSGFPLRMGSKGATVKALQQALINKYGASILPRYGADGSFGNEVANALRQEGLPAEIDQATFNSLVGQGSSGNSNGINASQLADTLYHAVENTDLASALSALKQMNSVNDYSAVNKVFETYTIGFVSKTLVNGLLDAFSDESPKQQIRAEFTRMGLKYDGSKWSLSGLPGYRLITNRNTEVCDKQGKTIAVKHNTLLGYVKGIRGEWAFFYPPNANVLLKVRKDSVKPFKEEEQ